MCHHSPVNLHRSFTVTVLPIFQMHKSTSLDKNAAKEEPSLLHMTILNSHSMTEWWQETQVFFAQAIWILPTTLAHEKH